MRARFHRELAKRDSAPILVLPFWEGGKEAAHAGELKEKVSKLLSTGDFKGRNGEAALVYAEGEKEERILLLGIGKEAEANVESIRRAYSSVPRFCQSKKIKSANLLLPSIQGLGPSAVQRGVYEGICLTNYAFSQWKKETLKDGPPVLLEQIGIIGAGPEAETLFDKTATICSSVFFARDLVNSNADDKIDLIVKQAIPELKARSSGIEVELLDRKALEREKMGLILAVSRGSEKAPWLARVSYSGDPSSKEHIVFVGKGITYDTGGLSLKPTDGMLTMKCDMSGAAAALGAVRAAADLKLKVNATALLPLAENSIDGNSYKLGDVYRSYTGRTVEINNTDAEGRLVLADAIGYAAKQLQPTCLVDLATLTGAMVIALGDDYSGLFATDETLAAQLLAASDATGEPAWRMPIVADYKESYKSDIADTLNSGGRDAGAIKGALFLQPFVGEIPWAHLDIAGPAYLSKPKHYNTTKATGYGVRLLVEFLEARAGR